MTVIKIILQYIGMIAFSYFVIVPWGMGVIIIIEWLRDLWQERK